MIKFPNIFVFSGLLALCQSGYASSILKLSEFQTSKENPALMSGEMRFEHTFELGKDRSLPVVVEVTSKGNGIMRALNVEFPVYKSHDDGDLFRNCLLDVELIDVDGDKYKDMIVYGIVDHTDEKSGKIISSEPILAIYHYDHVQNLMQLRFLSGSERFHKWFSKSPKPNDPREGRK